MLTAQLYFRCVCFVTAWQLGVLLLYVNRWQCFCIGGVETCALSSQTAGHLFDFFFFNQQSPLKFSVIPVLMFFSAYVWLCCSWEGFFFLIINKNIIGLSFNTMNTSCEVVCITGEGGEKQFLLSQLKWAYHYYPQ